MTEINFFYKRTSWQNDLIGYAFNVSLNFYRTIGNFHSGDYHVFNSVIVPIRNKDKVKKVFLGGPYSATSTTDDPLTEGGRGVYLYGKSDIGYTFGDDILYVNCSETGLSGTYFNQGNCDSFTDVGIRRALYDITDLVNLSLDQMTLNIEVSDKFGGDMGCICPHVIFTYMDWSSNRYKSIHADDPLNPIFYHSCNRKVHGWTGSSI